MTAFYKIAIIGLGF